jgi:hypothetical protein
MRNHNHPRHDDSRFTSQSGGRSGGFDRARSRDISGYGEQGGSDALGIQSESGQPVVHQHDDDYMHWRDEQTGKFALDNSEHQSERRKNFSEEVDKRRTDGSAKSAGANGDDSKK